MDYKRIMNKMMKERENISVEFEPCIGKVIKAPPETTISILDGQVTLYPHMLYMNDRLYDDYIYCRSSKCTNRINRSIKN